MKKLSTGELVFPIFAASYAIYMLWQEIDDGLRESSILYTMAVAIPVLILSPILIWKAFRTPSSPSDETSAATPLLPPLPVIIFVGITLMTLLLLEPLGYLLCFAGFVLATMILLGVRSPLQLTLVPIATAAVVHLVFVELLEMDLPKGILG